MSELTDQVEDLPSGYPRFAKLTSAHPSFFVFRQFLALRVRLTLEKQDRLSVLETRLHSLDSNETKVLFLGSLRSDRNNERRAVLAEIDVAVKDYGECKDKPTPKSHLSVFLISISSFLDISSRILDDCIARMEQTLERKLARPRDIENIRQWLAQSGSISRDECAYLDHSDLMAVKPSESDTISELLRGKLEDFVIWLSARFDKVNSCLYISRHCLFPLVNLH